MSFQSKYPHEVEREMLVQHAEDTIASLHVELFNSFATVVAKEQQHPTLALAQSLLSKSKHPNAAALNEFIVRQCGDTTSPGGLSE